MTHAQKSASRWRRLALSGNSGDFPMKRTLCRNIAAASLLLALPLAAVAQEYAKPTKEHEGMTHEVGEWDADVSMWMEPGGEPQKSKAVEKNEMLGKFWLMSKFEGEFQGAPFTGMSAYGYDPIKKKYTGGWVDSMSPFMMTMEGEYDDDSKTLTMMGSGTDFMTGKPCKMKMITKYESDDEKTFTMYGEDKEKKGEWQKTMEIKYTRRK
jgi:hypothetical protein